MFRAKPTYTLPEADEAEILGRIGARVAGALGVEMRGWQRLGTGQNPTYRLDVGGGVDPHLLLKIPRRKGYPAVETLQACYRLLRVHDVGPFEILYHDPGADIVPYGCFVQSWIPGIAMAEPGDADPDPFPELEDFARFVRRVHGIETEGFGYLVHGPTYSTVQAYFEHMDRIIDSSFGQVLPPDASIWALDRWGITAPGFLPEVLAEAGERAQGIRSPVQPVLLHGDMLSTNLVYDRGEPVAVDWDECRSGWWVYEIARTLYYIDDERLLTRFLAAYGEVEESMAEIRMGIQLEHVRQALRWLCIVTFDAGDEDEARRRVRPYEARVRRILAQPI